MFIYPVARPLFILNDMLTSLTVKLYEAVRAQKSNLIAATAAVVTTQASSNAENSNLDRPQLI